MYIEIFCTHGLSEKNINGNMPLEIFSYKCKKKRICRDYRIRTLLFQIPIYGLSSSMFLYWNCANGSCKTGIQMQKECHIILVLDTLFPIKEEKVLY